MAKEKIAYQDRFHFAGSDVFLQLLPLDGMTDELIEAKVEAAESSSSPDYTVPRIALLQNCVYKLNVDGIGIDLRPKQRSSIPKLWDGEKTLTTRMLELIVTHVDPRLAEQYENCFSRYLETGDDMAAFPTPSPQGNTSPAKLKAAGAED